MSANPKLPKASRAERVAQVQALKAQGLNGTQIAKQIGCSFQYVYALLNDPEGDGDRERKTRYGGVCVTCGNRTTARGDGTPASLCRACSTAVYWTPERIVEAVRRWADERGGVPPRSLDWGNAGRYHPDWYGGEFPHAESVKGRFGSFNAGLEAAGFAPHMHRNPGRFNDWGAIAERLRHEPVEQVAASLGTSAGSLRAACRYRGTPLPQLRDAA